ncbi:MAG TPA: hypothetical protein VFF81_08130 [Noviherbaspirillum sp.]|nr:hypothetical protein [Noviherbaspirillum sp.]
MQPVPYFERLSEAYALVDGIPDHQVTLDIERLSIPPETLSIGMNNGSYIAPPDWSALVLTPDIWLSQAPPYIDIVEPLIENWEPYGVEMFWRIEGRITSRFEIAMANLFNLTHELAEELFGMRSDDEADDRSDKQVFLDRIITFLLANGEAVTIGTGHIAQHEMREHGISIPDGVTAAPAQILPAEMRSKTEASGNSPPRIQTGFGILASESDAPGVETLDTEASPSAVSPIVHEQSVEREKSGDV